MGHSTPSSNQQLSTAAKGQPNIKPSTSKAIREKRYRRALSILGRIERNETKGIVHPKDAEDKIRFQAVVDEYRLYQATEHKDAGKRNRSQDEVERASKRVGFLLTRQVRLLQQGHGVASARW